MKFWFTLTSLHLRKILEYRFDFWILFFGNLIATWVVSYFLWKAVYTSAGKSEIAGYSFNGILMYSILIPPIDRMIRGSDTQNLSNSIYDGSLNRQLILPRPIFGFFASSQLVEFLMYTLQLLLCVPFLVMLFPTEFPGGFAIERWILTISFALIGACIYFLLESLVDLIAFWADHIWSLHVMIRFIVHFLGGGYVPLAFFPDSAQGFISYLPFKYILSISIEFAMGHNPTVGIFEFAVIAFWIFFLTITLRWFWRKGLRSYTGIGM
jgi:ABC-2 type transport system permease protein